MNLYLVQHGEAVNDETTDGRPLTIQGRADVETVAAFAARHASMELDCIVHSAKLRAQQSAEIIAEHIAPKSAVPAEGLSPDDDPEIWARLLSRRDDNVMLVGHLPHLNRLASLLLTGAPDREIVRFRMGGIVALARDEEGAWTLRWVLTPDVVS